MAGQVIKCAKEEKPAKGKAVGRESYGTIAKRDAPRDNRGETSRNLGQAITRKGHWRLKMT